jgi:hypothetical protein
MPDHKQCRETNCGHQMPLSMTGCPHCGRPSLFPNVDQAGLDDEREALNRRFETAVAAAESRGAKARIEAFAEAVGQARAVSACSFGVVQQLAGSDSKLASTFYMRGVTDLSQGSYVLRSKPWNTIRPSAESAFFGDDVKKRIHFAALSPDNLGLTNYGECSITLRTELISFRTSLLEENMLVFFKEKCADYWPTERIPVGYRSTWADRTRLAVAKLAGRIESSTDDSQFASILLTRGATTADDGFIELHIHGNMTLRTFETIVLNRPLRGVKRAKFRALQHKLEGYEVQWIDRSTTR